VIVMNGTGYKLIGFAVWNGGKWYLRRRLAVRRIALKAFAAGGGLLSAAALVRRRLSA
jgi:hypothetical protein